MSIPPRLRRLQKDYEKLQKLQQLSPFVDIYEAVGTPPEKYIMHLTCKGIRELHDETPVYAESFYLGIHLDAEYPRERPELQILADVTPVWHPNIARNGLVCYGDEGDHGWSPSMSLDDLVIRVIEMIRYENIGFASPFNQLASIWAANHKHLFPVDTRQILMGDLTDNVTINDDLGIVIVDTSQSGVINFDSDDLSSQIQIF